MKYVKVGKIYTTHGLRGEFKVKSNFPFKDKIYVDDFSFYVGDDKKLWHFDGFRKQNNYDLLLFKEICDISLAIGYRSLDLYVNKEDLGDVVLDSDFVGLRCYYLGKVIGSILNVSDQGGNNIVFLVKCLDGRKIFIPKNDNFINKIDIKSGIIDFINLEGLL